MTNAQNRLVPICLAFWTIHTNKKRAIQQIVLKLVSAESINLCDDPNLPLMRNQ